MDANRENELIGDIEALTANRDALIVDRNRFLKQRDQLLAALKELLSGQTIEGLRGQTGMMDICVTGEDVRAGLEAIAAVEQPCNPAA